LWEVPLAPGELSPTLVEYGIGTLAVPGVQAKPQIPLLVSINDGRLLKYDSMTGYLALNVSIAPMTGGGGTYYKNGYVLGIQDLGAAAGAERYRLINWTTMGTATNFANRIVSNTTYARSALPTSQLIDWNVGIGATVTNIQTGGLYTGMRLEAFDLLTGQSRWVKTVDEIFFNAAAYVSDHGKLAIMSAKGYYVAYDLRSGSEVWRTKTFDYPWEAPGFGSYSVTSA
jgi:outer membrane protein assembly factor BamB